MGRKPHFALMLFSIFTIIVIAEFPLRDFESGVTAGGVSW